MAELLCRAKSHWQDGWDNAKIASLTLDELRSHNARTQIGDIIVVRPDGWEWGGEECLPNFRVRKYPGVPVEDMKHLEQNLMQDEVKTCKLNIDKKEWKNETKMIAFIQSNRYIEIPSVIETKEVERTITIPLADLAEPSPFKYVPEEIAGAKLGYVTLKGVVDINTVEGNAINTYLLKVRKYSLKLSIWDEITKNNETVSEATKDTNFIDEIDVLENTPIAETVWKPEEIL